MQSNKSKKIKGLIIVSLFILGISFASAWIIVHQFPAREEKNDRGQAFNTRLPDANIKESGRNKLEIYMQASKDSAKIKELQQEETSDKRSSTQPDYKDEVFAYEYPPKNVRRQPHQSSKRFDDNERKVNDRLEKLYAAINSNENRQINNHSGQNVSDINKYDNNIAQLEALLRQVQQPSRDTNPEMKQIESVLDKVLDIQYPERINNRQANSQPSQGAVFTVTTSEKVSYEDSVVERCSDNAFFGLQADIDISEPQDYTTISAVIHGDQLLQDASVVKLRLLQDIFIKSTRIPAGTFLFGECRLSDQRLEIRFNSIAYNNVIYPVQLTAFDTDGNKGIYIPGAVGRDEVKSGAERAIQQMQLAALNPGIGAQAANAGIQTAQTFLGKKMARVQVNVKAGHRVLLKSQQS